MVDARVFYNPVKAEDYVEMWDFLKKELFPEKNHEKVENFSSNYEMKNYELDPELQGDLDAVKGVAGGLGNLGQSTQYNNS